MIKSTLEKHQSTLPVLALVLATFFWGSSFITVSSALAYTNPLTLVMFRFLVGAFFVFFLLKGRIHEIPAHTWKAGAICGFVIYLVYATNAIGLMSLQSSASGFLTALYVPITPLMIWVVYGKAPYFGAFLGAILAFTQLLFTGLFGALGLMIAMLFGVPLKDTVFNQAVCLSIVWLAIIVAFVQVLLSWAQRYVPAGRAAVIFAMESVFAAIIGWFAGENLGVMGLVGGALIVAGILCGELRLPKRRSR